MFILRLLEFKNNFKFYIRQYYCIKIEIRVYEKSNTFNQNHSVRVTDAWHKNNMVHERQHLDYVKVG